MSNLSSAFASHEQLHRAQVESETWGHLLPAKNVSHKGFILFAYSEYSAFGIFPIQAKFEKNADCNPWFYRDMLEFLNKKKLTKGKVYIFRGTCSFTDESFKFDGTIKPFSIKEKK